MKILKRILLTLLIVIAIPLIIALFLPNAYSSESEIVINKPKQQVFDYIKMVKNQDHFGKWQLSDPEMKTEEEGVDGTVGYKYSWDSEKLGKGAQVITNIVEGERMESDMFFFNFNDDAHHAYIITEEQSENQTLVKWGIKGESPYPFNFLSLFSNMDADFKIGLENLKEIIESQETYSQEINFALKYYEETFQNLASSIKGLSAAQLHYRASDDTWSVSQCAEHIVLTEKMIFDMVKGFMEKPVNPEQKAQRSLTDEQIMAMVIDRSEKFKAPEVLQAKGKYNQADEALTALKNQRKDILNLLKNTPIEELRNRINESPSGKADVYQTLLFLAGHTARHTLQIDEIKASEGFPKK